MKKMLMLVMAFTLFISFTTADFAGAKPRFKSPKKSFTTTPKKDNAVKSDAGTNKATTGTTTPAKRGFFGGGGLMSGLMIGGLAGMMFGGLFGGMGALGNLFGLIINVLAIVILFIAIRGIFRYFTRKNRFNNDPRDNNNRY